MHIVMWFLLLARAGAAARRARVCGSGENFEGSCRRARVCVSGEYFEGSTGHEVLFGNMFKAKQRANNNVE
jgi:hypothetical protein